ncbi:MAG TPA: RidA family protein [Candidatus Dormibacteraeota bacterium]|nr:RidA family protein [Candidatus Dormibacteraeota bacterium]
MSAVEDRLRALGHEVLDPGPPTPPITPAVRTGNLVFLSGHGARKDGRYVLQGKVGRDLDTAAARESAEITALNLLGALRNEVGDLDRVTRVVKLLGMVNCTPDYTEQSQVINGASDLLIAAFGERGRHARSAVGMASLPINLSVEIELVVEVEP